MTWAEFGMAMAGWWGLIIFTVIVCEIYKYWNYIRYWFVWHRYLRKKRQYERDFYEGCRRDLDD